MRKLYWIIPALLGVAALYYYMRSDATDAPDDRPILTEVERGEFIVTVQATGELRAKNSVQILGPSRMRDAGIWQTTISKILPEGTKVKKGDWVASLDKSGITGKFDETSTEIEKIETQLEQAKIDTAIELSNMRDQLSDLLFDLKEKELLVEQSKFEAKMIIQQAELALERIKRDYKQLLNNYELKQQQSRARIAEINTTLRQQQNKMAVYQQISSEFDVKAPEDGMLIYLSRWNGEKTAEGGQVSAWDPKVGELPDLSSMISVTYVNEVDISKILMGQEVEIGIDAFPDKKFRGQVTKVANVGQQLRNQDAKVFEIIVELHDSDSTLRPAMTTSNNILVRAFDDALYIPLEALSQDSLPYVIMKQGGATVRQEVLLGHANDDHVVIDLGLSDKDEIYLHYTGDHQALKWIGLQPADKEKAIQLANEENAAYERQVAERARSTKQFTGKGDSESSSTVIFFH